MKERDNIMIERERKIERDKIMKSRLKEGGFFVNNIDNGIQFNIIVNGDMDNQLEDFSQ
jgi:hypothetical protein